MQRLEQAEMQVDGQVANAELSVEGYCWTMSGACRY